MTSPPAPLNPPEAPAPDAGTADVHSATPAPASGPPAPQAPSPAAGPPPSPLTPALQEAAAALAFSARHPRHDHPAPDATLVDCFDLEALQELQDSFTGISGLPMRILNPRGEPITAPTDAQARHGADVILDQLLHQSPDAGGDCIEPMVAPIAVEGHVLGSLALDCRRAWAPLPQERARLDAILRRLDVDQSQITRILDAAEDAFAPRRSAAVQSLLILARHLAKRWQQSWELRNRVEELNALNKLSGLLTRHRDVQQVLDGATRMAVDVMSAKAASIRLIDDSGKELIEAASCNLSPAYRHKGRVLLAQSELARDAFAQGVVYVPDMRTDPRVIYREGAHREGLVSALIAPMAYRGRPVGLLQVYSGQTHAFSRHEVSLLQSLAQLTATAIENARLDAHRAEAQRVHRQLLMAADVQRRMIPAVMPRVPGLEIAARFVPSYELGGDFFDFLDLGGSLGVAVGDVVGKGIPASLLMAGVRGALRAFAQDLYDLDRIVARLNASLFADTLPNEFITLFYGVIDRSNLRLTYCNAGHDPGLLLRDGQIIRLQEGGMVLGIDPQQTYEKAVIDLRPGDLLVLHTDGLVDAQNFNNRKFGRERVIQAMRDRASAGAQAVLDHLVWEMRRFTGLNRNTDDTTVVVIRVGTRGRG